VTPEEFWAAYRLFIRRRPFRPFLIELTSGDRMVVAHPESVVQHGDLLVFSSPQRQYRLFTPATVAQLLDRPQAG